MSAERITAFDRLWALFVLVPQVRMVHIVAVPGANTLLDAWSVFGFLAISLLVGEALLRRFGPAVVGPLWRGLLWAAGTVVVGSVVVAATLGVELPEAPTAVAFLLVSAAVTVGSARRRLE